MSANSMNSERLRIDNLLASGKITEADHKNLMDALGAKKRKLGQKLGLIFNPYDHLSGGVALAVGVGSILLLSWWGSLFGFEFNGAMDFNINSASSKPFMTLLAQNAIGVLSTAAVFYAASTIFRRRNLRFLEFAGFVALARVPYLFMAAVLAAIQVVSPDFMILSEKIPTAEGLVVLVPLALFSLGWMIALLISGLRESSALKGKPLWVSFGLGLVVAEVVSFALNYWLL